MSVEENIFIIYNYFYFIILFVLVKAGGSSVYDWGNQIASLNKHKRYKKKYYTGKLLASRCPPDNERFGNTNPLSIIIGNLSNRSMNQLLPVDSVSAVAEK